MASSIFDDLFGPEPEEPKKVVQQPGLLRPSFVKRSSINIDQWFDPAQLWDYVREKRKGVPHGVPVEIPVAQITHPGLDEPRAVDEIAYFFGKQRDIAGMDTRAALDRILTPFLDDIEEALNVKRPKELGGRLRFDVAPDSSLTLFYIEK
jgi:hypothetical protein